MFRPLSPCSFRLREKASIFVAELHPARTAGERTVILARARKQYFDATHHCSAFREGLPVLVSGGSDDGEPGGTAGLPMLRILEGETLTDVMVVVTRWFGGTKLGTGGLVRAYSDAVRGVIDTARSQGLLEEAVLLRRGMISVPVEDAHLPYALLGAFPGAVPEEQVFTGGSAILTFCVPPGQEALMDEAWREKSRGGSITWLDSAAYG